MKPSRGLIVAGTCLACALRVHPAEARGPSTPGERARFVALVRSLEKDPLAESASATRARLREWMVEVPDIRFTVCADLLGHALVDDYPHSRELDLQVALSGGVLTIEHPGEARDDVAVYTAGVEGALRAYQALVRTRPDGRLAALDELVETHRRGELGNHIARLAKEKCRRTNIAPIAAAIGAAVGLALALVVARWFGGGAGRGSAAEAVIPAKISRRVAARRRNIVLVCAAYYLSVGVALHFLEPEYDPRFFPMSHYAFGAYGWLMTTTFFVLALAAVTVAVGLRRAGLWSRSARLGFGLLVVAAPFLCLAGMFKGFPLHDVGSAIALPSLAMAVSLLSWSFRTVPGWRTIGPATCLIAVGMLAAFLSILAGVGMPGLQQRAFLFLLLLWFSIVAHRWVRVTAGAADAARR
jgi:hypothetical membrane protein